jgi:hypothetical protein
VAVAFSFLSLLFCRSFRAQFPSATSLVWRGRTPTDREGRCLCEIAAMMRNPPASSYGATIPGFGSATRQTSRRHRNGIDRLRVRFANCRESVGMCLLASIATRLAIVSSGRDGIEAYWFTDPSPFDFTHLTGSRWLKTDLIDLGKLLRPDRPVWVLSDMFGRSSAFQSWMRKSCAARTASEVGQPPRGRRTSTASWGHCLPRPSRYHHEGATRCCGSTSWRLAEGPRHGRLFADL